MGYKNMLLKTDKTLHSATWWKGKVTVEVQEDVEVIVEGRMEVPRERTTISPIEDKLVPYNPFDFYFHSLRAGQRRAMNLYHRFVMVDPQNHTDVQRFCEEFGVFGDPKKTWEQWNATGTSLFSPPYSGMSDDPLSNRMTTKSRTPLHPTLCVPMSLHEFQLEQSAMKSVLHYVQEIEQKKIPKKAKEYAREELIDRLAGELTKVSQCPRWDQKNKRWVSHWDSLSLVAIMYQMLFFDLLGPGKNVRCEKCGNPFLAQHPRAQHCSERCRNTRKKARQRRKKQKRKFNDAPAKVQSEKP